MYVYIYMYVYVYVCTNYSIMCNYIYYIICTIDP